MAEQGLEALAKAGTVIVPSWRGVDAPPPPALLDALRAAHARGARLLSYCSGVFVLAATGLLDGRRATTHWRYAEALAARYPRIRVEPDVLYVDEGSLLTSAGSAAALDLSLHLIRRDYGPRAANLVARRVVVPAHRDGGQAQFIAAPLPERGDTLGRLLDWMRRHLDQALPLEELAARANLSERTLMRRFHAATGCSPKQWLIRERVNRARELLESGTQGLDRVAERCGFGCADSADRTMRSECTADWRAASCLSWRRWSLDATSRFCITVIASWWVRSVACCRCCSPQRNLYAHGSKPPQIAHTNFGTASAAMAM
ncbi:helix-turn-helix domain-containing protein [Frateuria defendens]|uniref:helix-turn-helix domain-containing protein n=1 Tax=Frateuria defendens TaxID=2219559 RepID=UPI000B0F7F73|nr:helix-turn-helix domain-containing protein [Frateuria defendens]